MKSKFLFFLLISGFGIISSCNESTKQSIETPEPEFTKEGELIFTKPNGDTISVFAIEIAKSSYEKQTGLMYRKSMGKKQGMLFIYTGERPRNGFYMKNTYIPLDLIYINGEKKIVDFNENTEPLSETPLPSSVPAKYVLEVNAGTVENLGLEIGDLTVIEIP